MTHVRRPETRVRQRDYGRLEAWDAIETYFLPNGSYGIDALQA